MKTTNSLLIDWLLKDGNTTDQCKCLIRVFKRSICLPTKSITKYSKEDLLIFQNAEKMYDEFRIEGLNHSEATAKLQDWYYL